MFLFLILLCYQSSYIKTNFIINNDAFELMCIIYIILIFAEADKKGDKSTHDRCLQKHLVLVTQVKLGKDVKTILPQGVWTEGETLRQVKEYFILSLVL